MELPDLPNHRRHARVEQELDVRLFEGVGVVDGEAQICDLGLGGMRLRSPVAMPVGSLLRFKLTLPRLGLLEGAARVRWIEDLGHAAVHGLEFEGLGLLDRRLLTRYLFPGRFGPMEALDLGLQCALTLTCLFVVRELLTSDPALRSALLQSLPVGLIVVGAGLGVLLRLRRSS